MKRIISMIFSALLLIGCNTYEDITLDETVGTLGINGFLYSQCDTNKVLVTLTGMGTPTPVKNATVELRVNGNLCENKTASDSLQGKYYGLKTIFNPGDHIRVDVYYGNQHAFAEDVCPAAPKDLDAAVEFEENYAYRDAYDEFEIDDLYKVTMSFADADGSKENYYRVSLDKHYGYEGIVEKVDRKTIYVEYENYPEDNYVTESSSCTVAELPTLPTTSPLTKTIPNFAPKNAFTTAIFGTMCAIISAFLKTRVLQADAAP